MNSNALRQAFLEFFQKNGHKIVPSSALVPAEDPTLLFTNAGMVQFKDIFLGKKKLPYSRAVTAQRCVRAGGKHNDLENVGYTARHHTFFEMLGNFSFGDYFKREAIQYAWTFLTEVLHIPADRLWVTVYKEDDEAADIWLKEMRINPQRFSRCDEKDNFWSMGDTGPCGPCSEIFYDHGEGIPGGPPGSLDQEGDRYIEIWNLVFMQYNRASDGTMTPLPKPSVDTGMGLERIAAVLQGVHNNYEIDIFRHLIDALSALVHAAEKNPTSLRVIADHIRSAAFLITDGVTPSNEGRGYVLRRIIRRAIRHGHKLGLRKPFFYLLVAPLIEVMGSAYPELTKARVVIEKVLQHEEMQFANTLDQGMRLLEQTLTDLKGNIISGAVVFRLYDTYGFPPDLTADIARERNLDLDYVGFEAEMEKQREKSQAASQFTIDYTDELKFSGETEFTGYDNLSDTATVTGLIQNGKIVSKLTKDQTGIIILDRTPFYAESGGQVGDKGHFYFETGVFHVRDTKKQGTVYFHHGLLETGVLEVGMKVTAEVDASRHAIMLNHSATHLLHSALRRLLGEHVIQKGSLVDATRLRFDFSHFTPLTAEEIQAIERLVNQQIRANLKSHTEFMTPEAAKKSGAMALFDEKYGDQVRVLSMGAFSSELCGGTHVAYTGQIGLFKIVAETGIAAGIRRIEAVTGEKALDWIDQAQNDWQELANLLKTGKNELISKVKQLQEEGRARDKVVSKLRQELLQIKANELILKAVNIGDVSVLSLLIAESDMDALRELADRLKNKISSAVIFLGTIANEKVHFIAAVTPNCTDKVKAGDLMRFVAEQVGGKGGGRPDMAQGGGDRIDQIDQALASVVPWVEKKLGA